MLLAEVIQRHAGGDKWWGGFIKGTNGAISAKTVTYDFERLMEGATSLSSSAFGDVLVAHM